MNEDALVVGQSEFAGQTTVHPLGLLAVAVLGLCLLFLPRRWSVLPMLVMACFVSSAQRIVIASLDFDFLRIMVLFGAMRLILRKEYHGFVWKPLDTAMTLWTLSAMFLYVLREGSFSAVVNRLGVGFDAFGMYFLFRCLVHDWADVDPIITGLILISVPVAAFFLLENRTGRNVFSVFGGVHAITVAREGRLRCQGAFSHAILAGCFWASVMPLMAAYAWKSAKGRVFSIIGLTMSVIIVVCCASSTPVLGVLSAVIGGLFFIFRRYMRIVRWSLLVLLVALHLMMQAPVWHLISRVSAVGGSTGWHRFNLINQAILNFGDWWLVGCSGDTVASWGIWAGDVTNQYLLMGVTGGIVTMLLFIAIIVIAFREVGRLWRSHANHPFKLALSWALGVSLFVHCVMFIGVSYFGQIYLIWYLLLAMIGSMSSRNVSSINQRKRKNLEY
ncbi:MAG: hypothetical protein GXY41_07515 [Phycisphaerae bacterium]|nr:hypothetical protein [Phycisphaerae bacterium]